MCMSNSTVTEQFCSWVVYSKVCLHMGAKSATDKNVLSGIMHNSSKLKAAQMFRKER